MRKAAFSFGFFLLCVALVGCGDSASGGSGPGGQSQGGAPALGGGAPEGGTANAGGEAGDGGAPLGGAGVGGAPEGGAPGHCSDAFNCSGVQGYFCYEISGPSAAFEASCADELFGTFAEGPCDPLYSDGGCLFDCIEPSYYSFAVGVDQAQCEAEGGTYVDP